MRCREFIVLLTCLVLTKHAETVEALGWTSPAAAGGPSHSEGSGSAVSLDPPVQDWFPVAAALPEPKGTVVEVSTVGELVGALEHAECGQTIRLADGHYPMPRYVEVRADDVTVRSASGDRQRVILDGAESRHGELLGFRNCSGVTVADLTIQNVRYNGFKINSETNVQDLTIRNCIIHNVWQRGVKGVKVPPERREAIRPRHCRIQYCLFYNDRPKRLSDDPADIANGNYIAGIDVMYATDWVISDNVFVGIQGRTYEGRGAIFLWFDARDCLIERNIMIDCDVGLQLGNPHRADGVQVHCTGCVARNNFITRAPEAGIVTTYTRDCEVLHNTIHDPENRLYRLLRMVCTNEGLRVANNLLSGPGMRNESDSDIRFAGNLVRDMTHGLADPCNGDLHLTEAATEAIGRAAVFSDVAEDIDGAVRDEKPDIGADELTSVAPQGSSHEIDVADSDELRRAAQQLAPGATLSLRPGVYRGGLHLANVRGTSRRPVVIEGSDPNDPPVFRAGGTGIQLSDCNHLILRNIMVEGFPGNGINIDDGGSYETPSHHVVVEKVTILATGPTGNHDALKMSGVDHFTVRECHFEGWGGSGIDMVGCHHGVVEDCTFVGREGFSQSNGVQLKGGTRDVLVHRCLFKDAGQRSINLGGSTGLPFFRPEVQDYEARDITIAGNRFVGGSAAVAWVTADGGYVHHNTIVMPEKWVLRILQETNDPRFRSSHGGLFERNLIVYDSRVQVFVNVGPHTAPESFLFRRNVWCDRDGQRVPALPVAEGDGTYVHDLDLDPAGLSNGIVDGEDERLCGVGAAAYRRPR